MRAGWCCVRIRRAEPARKSRSVRSGAGSARQIAVDAGECFCRATNSPRHEPSIRGRAVFCRSTGAHVGDIEQGAEGDERPCGEHQTLKYQDGSGQSAHGAMTSTSASATIGATDPIRYQIAVSRIMRNAVLTPATPATFRHHARPSRCEACRCPGLRHRRGRR